MSKSIPNRTNLSTGEGAAVATSKQALEQFRQYLLERVSDAAKQQLRGAGYTETAAGNGLRELWEKSDLPSGIFADEVARFWKLPRLNLQHLTNAVGAIEQFSPRFLRESSVFPFRVGNGEFGL